MKKALLLIIAFFLSAPLLRAQEEGYVGYTPLFAPEFKSLLPEEVRETSGLFFHNGRLWTHNDSGGKPILYVGMGEKPEDLEPFYPDRMASRILGMGDVMSLIEKATQNINEEKAREMETRFRKATFGFDDYLESMAQMKQMGGMSSILQMMPGMGNSQLKGLEDQIDESQMAKTEAIILSMTPQERANPDLLNQSRKNRIARGAGVDISEVNKLVKQFDQARKLMKQFGGQLKGKKKGGFRLPFGGGGLF